MSTPKKLFCLSFVLLLIAVFLPASASYFLAAVAYVVLLSSFLLFIFSKLLN